MAGSFGGGKSAGTCHHGVQQFSRVRNQDGGARLSVVHRLFVAWSMGRLGMLGTWGISGTARGGGQWPDNGSLPVGFGRGGLGVIDLSVALVCRGVVSVGMGEWPVGGAAAVGWCHGWAAVGWR